MFNYTVSVPLYSFEDQLEQFVSSANLLAVRVFMPQQATRHRSLVMHAHCLCGHEGLWLLVY